MYCCIRNFKDYQFIGDISKIKEVEYNYHSLDITEKLNITKDTSKNFVFSFDYSYKPKEEELKEMRELSEIRKNIKFKITNRFCRLSGLPFFYGLPLAANTLGEMRALIEIGVTDIYITGDLAFNMEQARTMADRYEIKLRIVPNIAQVSGFTYLHRLGENNLTAFWIRPEDLDLYEKYIDVVEFQCLDDKQAIFYDIYFENKQWNGMLDEIIEGVKDIDNRGLISPFTESRLNCGNVCHIDKCHRCYRYLYASNLIVDNNLKIEKES